MGEVGVAQDEALLVRPDGGADDLGRDVEEGLVEGAHQHDRPFDQPGDLVEKRLVLDELEPARESEVLRLRADDVPAAFGVEHDPGAFERDDVIVEAAHLHGRRRHEAMPSRDVAGADAVDLERHHVRDLGLGPEGADDRLERAHPAQRPGLGRLRAPAHGFRPGEIADDGGQDLGQHLRRRAAGALDHGNVELALLGVRLDPRLIEGGEAGSLEETLDRLVGRADARTAPLLAHVLTLGGQPDDVQREAPRRREGACALVEEAALDEGVRDQLAQVLGGAPLHAGGDFLGQKFEQEIGHIDYSPPPCGQGSWVGGPAPASREAAPLMSNGS